MRNADDRRRETLEQLAAEGDEEAAAGLWLEFGVERKALGAAAPAGRAQRRG